MAKSSSYSAKNVAGTLDGQKVQGLWEGDDAIVVASSGDIGTGMTGADGDSIFSQRAGTPHTITLRLQHTSPTHRLLHQKWAMQRAEGIRIIGFPFSVMDVDSGEGGATDQCFIQTAPNDSKGVNAVAREWVLWTGQWIPEIPAG